MLSRGPGTIVITYPTAGSEVIDGNIWNSWQARETLEDHHGDRSLWARGGGRGRRARLGRQLELQLLEQLELELIQQLEFELLEQLELQLVEQLELELIEEVQEGQEEALVSEAVALASHFGRWRAGAGARLARRSRPRIEFLCEAEDKGVIAEPVPARTVQPTWFRRLPGQDRAELSATNNGLTVKRCVPFLDALSIGWIVPLAATVRLEITDGGQKVSAGWEFDREMVSPHGAHQAAGNPYEPRPMMKFHNPWTIRTPRGWSCLFVPPLNRPDGVVEVLSGVVDTDVYVSPINFPFVAVAEDGVHTLYKGTPLVQVIPFAREDERLEGEIRAESEQEAVEREQVYRNTLAGEGWYRSQSRSKR